MQDKINLHEQEGPRLIPCTQALLVVKEGNKEANSNGSFFEHKSLHSHKINSKWINSAAKGILSYMEKEFLVHADLLDNNFKFAFDKAFKLFRYMLVVFQFFLRLPIVPLLLVQ